MATGSVAAEFSLGGRCSRSCGWSGCRSCGGGSLLLAVVDLFAFGDFVGLHLALQLIAILDGDLGAVGGIESGVGLRAVPVAGGD